MAGKTLEQNTYKKITTGVDLLAVLSFVFLVIVCPLWTHYNPHIRDTQGRVVWMVKASLVVTPLCALGLIWLCVRGARSMPALYFRPLYCVHWVITCLAMNYFVYLILTNLVWS
jgi:hypothetical protein